MLNSGLLFLYVMLMQPSGNLAFLADGIYPDFSYFFQKLSQPQGLAEKHFIEMQESCHKDVEHAFGILQSQFSIVKKNRINKRRSFYKIKQLIKLEVRQS